ncbi:MAG: MFS transporter [Promethearchaeota archaeon]|nr:MAG: MFS transporter [Candidatus Lokiarchaeota archaeon]
MNIFPPKDVFTKFQWLSIFACLIAGTLLWISHFLWEYLLLIANSINIWWVAISYLGCIVGGMVILWVNQRVSHYIIFILCYGAFGGIHIALKWVSEPWIIIVGLFLLGLTGGGFVGVMFTQLSPAFPDPKYNGRVNGLGYATMNFLILLLILMDFFPSKLPITIMMGVFTGGTLLLAWVGRHDANITKQHQFKVKLFLANPLTSNRLIIAFFWGFFLTLPFYAAINLILHHSFSWNLNQFIITVFVTIATTSLPNGLLLDKLGRKKVMLFGIGMLSMAFFVLFLPISDMVLEILFPVILGIGTTLFLTSNSLIFIEFTEKHHLRDYFTIYYILMAVGMFGGVVLGLTLEDLYLDDPIYLTVVLLFLFLIATIVISQTDETLPKKEELDWKNAIQRIYIMYQSGVPIYSQMIKSSTVLTAQQENMTEELLSGTLVTVSSILDEISRSQRPLKVIKREELSILIENCQNVLMVVFTSEELSKIREKMQVFLQEFVDFFEDALRLEVTNQTVFLPAKKLVQKHFFYYW